MNNYYDIEEEIENILMNYKNISYYFNDYNYFIEFNNFYGDIDEKERFDKILTFKNIVIHFDGEFINYDISKTITEKLKQFHNYIIDGIDIFDIIKIIEKKKNNDYVLIYSFKPFNNNDYDDDYDEDNDDEDEDDEDENEDEDNEDNEDEDDNIIYYNKIKELLTYICDIKNYKYKLNENEIKNDYPDYQYKILNEDYIIEDFKEDKFNIGFIKINDDNVFDDEFNDLIEENYNQENSDYENLLIDAVSYLNEGEMKSIYFKSNIICFKDEQTKKKFINYLLQYKNHNNLCLIDFKIKVLGFDINIDY